MLRPRLQTAYPTGAGGQPRLHPSRANLELVSRVVVDDENAVALHSIGQRIGGRLTPQRDHQVRKGRMLPTGLASLQVRGDGRAFSAIRAGSPPVRGSRHPPFRERRSGWDAAVG